MGIAKNTPNVLIKYVRGIHRYVQNELALFEVHSIDEAYVKALYIKNHGKRKVSISESSTQLPIRKNGEVGPRQNKGKKFVNTF